MAWVTLAYTIAVIVYGAWVRVTGSGAGCGKHWPTCHGDVVPRAHSIETAIEFTHRLTSGLSLIFVVGIAWLAFRWWERGAPVRRAAVLSVVFILTEALIGAGLVLFGLVDDNDSSARAISMSIHLVNTFILLAALMATIWSARSGRRLLAGAWGWRKTLLLICAVSLVIVSMSGAVTALGDTLYPIAENSGGVAERFRETSSASAPFLVRVRIIHPMLSIFAAVFMCVTALSIASTSEAPGVKRAALVAGALVTTQVAIGVANILLSAPGAMQLLHLFAATLVWCSLVALTFESGLAQGAGT